MLQFNPNSYGGVPAVGGVPRNAPPAPVVAAPADDMSEEALEQFLSGWTSGQPGSDHLSLDQMLKIQGAPPAPEPSVSPAGVQNSPDHALRQIELLVAQNRQIFKGHRPASMTDGWNIAH